MCLIPFFYHSYLYSNQLTGSIPSTIGSLTNLVDLYEQRNPIPSHSVIHLALPGTSRSHMIIRRRVLHLITAP